MPVKLVNSSREDDWQYYYSVFRTAWGWVGLAGNDVAIVRLVLPGVARRVTERAVSEGLGKSQSRNTAFAKTRQEVTDYFDGRVGSFSCSVDISWASPFAQKVLRQCCQLGWAERTSYGDLARRVGCPGGARAVGAVLAKNRAPLLVPCHRVIRADGSLGGFSGDGGIALKKRMLGHEGHDDDLSGV